MVALLGGRGGVDIPDDDRRGVYNHLSRHYGEFDKDPPEFKHYTEADLKAMDVGPPGWESVEIEERDPVEIMRMEGLAKADKDGIVPVTTELWNSIMDSFASIAEKEAKVEFERETEVELIEVAEEEISLMVQLELENKELEESLRKLSHAYKLLNAKFEVLQGGIG
jgi:hypothetical protein